MRSQGQAQQLVRFADRRVEDRQPTVETIEGRSPVATGDPDHQTLVLGGEGREGALRPAAATQVLGEDAGEGWHSHVLMLSASEHAIHP